MPAPGETQLPRLSRPPRRAVGGGGAELELQWRSRWRRQVRVRRLGGFEAFMPVTVLMALVLVPLFGIVANRLYDADQVAPAQARELDRRVVQELTEQGFAPARDASGALLRPFAQRGVGVFTATRSFRLDLVGGPVTGEVPGAGSVDAALVVLGQELGRYSRGCLRAVRFRRILLCEGLAESGQEIPSLPNYEQSLMLDVRGPAGFLRRLLHHELFHFLDFADDEQLAEDPEWEALNPPGFSYGLGGRSMRQPGSARLSTETSGFLSRYSTSAVEEDKAEVFAFLLTAPEQVRRIMEQDVVVRAKVAAIERQVAKLCPGMSALQGL
ncbi:MAG: hypothetical protein JW940_20115 [Polyangiaceae bacterium]|nr:hypothetical protein [Polyangiaceae bacterium]